MIFKQPRLRYAALAALVTAASYTSLPAYAADAAAAKPDELQEVVITGSLLRRTDTESPSPVSVLTADDLTQRGINTVAEAVQRLSANGSGAITQGWNNGSNFAAGANAVSLRGMTVQDTLTIFDGVRMAPYPLADDGHRNFVDLNTIPDAIIDRIEILKDGASSTYGADAIAGVVNVITKKEIQGIHLNVSGAGGVNPGGSERRFDATYGVGSLADQGWNFYMNGEYQNQGAITAGSRQYPFNTNDLTGICDPSGVNCLANAVQFGINKDGTLGAGTTTTAPLVAPSSVTGSRSGVYSLLNPSAGCGIEPGLTPVTLTAAQAGTTWATSQCQQDLRKQYQTVQPQQQRQGFSGRFTAKLGSNAEFYVMGSYYDVKTYQQLTPLTLASSTPAPTVVSFSPIVLPVYVCAAGVGTISSATGVNTSTGCTAANGTLNPNNPFAATGGNAILRWRYDRPRERFDDGRSLRGATGVSGSFGDDWRYTADFTMSNVRLNEIFRNWLIPQNIATAVAQGTFSFVNPLSNSETVRNFIAPDDVNSSTSRLWQGQATISKKLAELPGGALEAAVGASYRNESITNPSANPDNTVAPYTRYYSVNAVGATGSRNVTSGFFELNAPFIKNFEANLSGRYDNYSSGQTNFSPKLGLKYKPVDQLALRGTISQGFRIPSFNEAYGLPTTGYSTVSVNCTTYATWCASHGGNSYATAPYSLGSTLVGNPSLNPEKSTSYTFGVVVEPVDGASLTIDYWNSRVKGLVSQVSAADRTNAINQYYSNNGVVNITGITVSKGAPDPSFPNALPQLGTINASYTNANQENLSGLDFGVNVTRQLFGGNVKWMSALDASYLLNYTLKRTTGAVEDYAGSLSPCDYTSCSGSPQWRGSWGNTFVMGKVTLTGTAYYTSGYRSAEVDYGADPTQPCAASSLAGDGPPVYKGTTIPSQCSVKPQWNFDMNGRYAINEKLTVYLDAMNVFNIAPVRDYAAAYAATQYNPAWGQENIIGRFFRLGLKADF